MPPLWRRILVPPTVSDRHAIAALVLFFLMEGLTEVYQILTTIGSVRSAPLGYYLSIVLTVVGFYFLWRGLHEWGQLHPRARRVGPRKISRVTVGLLLGGIGATAVLNVALGNVGGGNSPALLSWVVSGVLVLAVGAFFLRLREMVAPLGDRSGRALGWAAFVWSLGVSTIAGLTLGQGIVGLFIDFFTNWPQLILGLAPFIFAIAPLFVTYGLMSITYADAYRRASSASDAGRPGGEATRPATDTR